MGRSLKTLWDYFQAIAMLRGRRNDFRMNPGRWMADLQAAIEASGGYRFKVLAYQAHGSSTDITDALAAAYADAADAWASGFPSLLELAPGTWYTGALLAIEASFCGLICPGPGVARLRMEAGANLGTMVRLGYPVTSTSVASNQILAGITLDGNHGNQASGTGGLLQVCNSRQFRVLHVECREAFGQGFVQDTYADTVPASLSDRGLALDLNVHDCEGQWAAEIRGAKNDHFDHLFVQNNGRGGLLLQGRQFESSDPPDDPPDDNLETTQCQLTSFHVTDNGLSTAADGLGVVFDNTTRWLVRGGHLNFNPAGALRWRRSLGTDGIDGANQGIYEDIIARNNGSDASCDAIIKTDASGDLTSATLRGFHLQNAYAIADQKGMFVEGASELVVDDFNSRLGAGVALHLKSCDVRASNVDANANGAATPSAVTPHGIWLEGCRGQLIGVRSRNAKTNSTHGGRELYVSGTPAALVVDDFDLKANEAGYELLLDATARSRTRVGDGVLRDDASYKPTLVLVDDATAGSGNQTIALPDDASAMQTCVFDGTAGAVTIARIEPLWEGALMLVTFINGANVTFKHNVDNLLFAGGADEVGSGTKGVPLLCSGGNWYSVL